MELQHVFEGVRWKNACQFEVFRTRQPILSRLDFEVREAVLPFTRMASPARFGNPWRVRRVTRSWIVQLAFGA